MFSFIEYLSSWFYNNPETSKNANKPKCLISSSDLLSVKLVSPTIYPQTENKKNTSMFRLQDLNNAQLSEILNVKLKLTNNSVIIHNKKTYQPRHPVLKELIDKVNNQHILDSKTKEH